MTGYIYNTTLILFTFNTLVQRKGKNRNIKDEPMFCSSVSVQPLFCSFM